MITVYYNYHDENAQVVNHQYQVSSYTELEERIHQYPWQLEIEQFEQSGEGGGISITNQPEESVVVNYLLVPVESDTASLYVDVCLSRGWLGLIGRRSVSYSYPSLALSDAIHILKEIFDCSPEDLYQQYRLKKKK